MAVVETLEVRFQADIGKFSQQLSQLAARVNTLGNALESGKTTLAGNAAGLVRSVAEALRSGAAMSSAPMEAGRLLTDGFSRAITGGRGMAAASAVNVASAADFSAGGAVKAATSAGAALSRGFANGISSGSGSVMQAVNRVVNAAVSRIRSALQIHSPSRVSFELGGFFGEGFAEGVRASIRMTEESVAALSLASAAALESPGAAHASQADAAGLSGMVRAAVSEAMGGTSIVIPLNVDGVKLGEASIRGINRVTRSAGRLMLEI